MSTSLHLFVASVERGPVQLTGALPGSVLDLGDDPSVGEVGEICYELRAEKKSGDILVRGWVSAEIELECVRSGLFFSTIVEEKAFLRDYSISELTTEMIDLTEEVRESVLLAIPTYPVSPEARSETYHPPGLPPEVAGEAPEAGSSPWTALDNLNLS